MRRRHCSGPYNRSRDGQHESQSRMRRFYPQHPGNAAVQSPGHRQKGRSGRNLLFHADRLFQRTANAEKVELTNRIKNSILIKPCSRGVSGALYLQSALVGVMLDRGLLLVQLPFISGVEVRVLRNGNP